VRPLARWRVEGAAVAYAKALEYDGHALRLWLFRDEDPELEAEPLGRDLPDGALRAEPDLRHGRSAVFAVLPPVVLDRDVERDQRVALRGLETEHCEAGVPCRPGVRSCALVERSADPLASRRVYGVEDRT
jgi:hypothetical protein